MDHKIPVTPATDGRKRVLYTELHWPLGPKDRVAGRRKYLEPKFNSKGAWR